MNLFSVVIKCIQYLSKQCALAANSIQTLLSYCVDRIYSVLS